MGFIKKCLLVSIGFGLAGAIGASFATGTAQAIVAALVQVANTTSAPVPINNVNDPGRRPYQAQAPTQNCSHCFLSFPTVPAGHRVVVQHISGEDGFSSPPSYVLSFILPNNSQAISSFLPPFSSAAQFYEFDQPVLVYVDSGNSLAVELDTDGTFGGIGYVTLSGYELDCTVAACEPIASQ